MAPGGFDQIDSREVRAAQAAVAIALLAGFVFGWAWLVPAMAAVVVIGAVAGPQANPFAAAYRTAIGPRLARARVLEERNRARALDVLGAALLVPATLALVAGIDPLAWFLALVAAAVAAVFATTGANAAARLAERFDRDDRDGR